MNPFKIILLTCAIALGIISCGSENKERAEHDLFPVPRISLNSPERLSDPSSRYKDKDGRPVSGYIGRNGQLVINLQFDYADEFSNGLARVMIDKKFGYINTSGEFVIKPQFDNAENFGRDEKEPLALVRVGNKYGYINKSGNYVISPQFDDASSFTIDFSEVPDKWSYTLARVKVGDNWGFIDKSGNYVIAPQFRMVGSFSQGRAAAQVGNKCGYIDETGKMVIAAQFDCTSSRYGLSAPISELGDFSWGLARVKVMDKPTQVKIPTNPVDDVVYPGTPTFKYGFIDRTGKFVIEPQFEMAGDFSGGLAAVGFAKSITVLQGIERQDGKIISENRLKSIVKWGFINETGRIVINPMFDSVENFKPIAGNIVSGVKGKWLAAVVADEGSGFSCGYIDKTGKYVFSPQVLTSIYPLPSPSGCNGFSAGGFAYVGSNDTSGYSIIDDTGKTIFSYHR